MKNSTAHLNRILERTAFLLSLTLLLFIYGPVSIFSQGLYVVSITPSVCGGASGEVIFGVTPTPIPNQLTVNSVLKISPHSGVIVNGPITITPASYTLSNLEFGNYFIDTDQGQLEFTINDNSYWPYQAEVYFSMDIGTRAFNKDLKVDNDHCVHAAGIFNGPIKFYQNFYWPIIFNGYYLKLNECGKVLWDHVISGSTHVVDVNLNANFITSNQELIMCGNWSVAGSGGTTQTLYLNGQTLTTTGDGLHGFIGMWDIATGLCQWVRDIKGPSVQLKVKDLCSDGEGNIFVYGDYKGDSPLLLQDINSTYTIVPPISPNTNDAFLAVFSSNGTLIDAENFFISSQWYDDFAGGLTAFPSDYPSTGGYVGGNLTEIITTGQGGLFQPSQSFSGQRWVLDNTTPKSLKYVSLFDIVPPPGSMPAGSQDHFGMCVDYYPYNGDYMLVFTGLVRIPGSTASRQFIASYREPQVWSLPLSWADQIFDYKDFMDNAQTQLEYNVASNVVIDQNNGNIKVSGVQHEPGAQFHPYQGTPQILVGGPTPNGYLFIDNFRPDLLNLEIGGITGTNYSVHNAPYLAGILSDESPEVYNWGYGALCSDVDSRFYYSGNFHTTHDFVAPAVWGAVYNTPAIPLSPFFIARFIDNYQGSPQFKNSPANNSGIVSTQKSNIFSLSPNPAIENTYIYCQNSDVKIITLEIFELSGKLLIKMENFEGCYPQKINLSDLSKGIYLVKLISSTSVETKKLVVQ